MEFDFLVDDARSAITRARLCLFAIEGALGSSHQFLALANLAYPMWRLLSFQPNDVAIKITVGLRDRDPSGVDEFHNRNAKAIDRVDGSDVGAFAAHIWSGLRMSMFMSSSGSR